MSIQVIGFVLLALCAITLLGGLWFIRKNGWKQRLAFAFGDSFGAASTIVLLYFVSYHKNRMQQTGSPDIPPPEKVSQVGKGDSEYQKIFWRNPRKRVLLFMGFG